MNKLIIWLREFPTTNGIAFGAMFLILLAGLIAIVKWSGPPGELQAYLFIAGGLGAAGTLSKRLTDKEYNQIKGETQVRTAAATASGVAPSKVTVTQPAAGGGPSITEIEPAAPPAPGGS